MGYRNRSSCTPKRTLLACALAACTVLGVSPQAIAQSTSATLRGAAANDSTISITNIDTGLSRTVKAANGTYQIGGLPPGTYRIEVNVNGQTASRAVTLQVGQTATLNLSAPETTAPTTPDTTTLDTVRVSAPILIETKTSEIATYVSQKQIEALPQNSRNFLAFADTVPGMQFISSVNGDETQLRSGAQGASNINVFIDGVGQKNYVTPGGLTGQDDSRGNPFPQSAIGEYKVITSNYKAEYDQISSAAVTAVTKSGTNEFHGSFFWDRTSDEWRKATPREDVARAKNEERTEQYGVTLGGPLIRDKLHFFVSYEAKDFVIPADILPPNQVDPASLPASIVSQYGGASRPFKQDLYFGKLSWQATDNHLIEFTARYRDEQSILDVGGVNSRSAATAFVNDETRYDLRSVYSAERWMNDAHITFEDSAYNPQPLTKSPSNRYTVVDPNNPNNLTLTILNMGGGGNYQDKGQKGWGFQDDFTFFGWEGHTLKAGIKYKHVELNAFQQFPPYPRYWYDVNENLTQPYRIEYTTARVGRDPFVESKNKQFGIYIQDDWDVTEKLTLNLGVRWDYEEIPSYTDYRLDPAIATALRGWTNIRNTDYNIEDYISNGRNRDSFKGAWQPRLGFSYDLSGDQRHVIFGGAGRAYDRNLFDYMAREYYGGAFTTYTINFNTPIHRCNPSASCIPYNPALLTPDGLAAYAAANPTAGGEVQLLNNDLKTPYSDQFSLGMRNVVSLWGHDWNTSVTLSHIRSKDGIYFRLGNRRANGSFHEFPEQTWGNAPFGFAIPGYGSLILADNGFEYKLNSVLISVDKPFTQSSPWGFNLAYTYSDAEENRPNASNGETSLFDYPFASDRFYVSTGVPKHRLVLSGIYSPGWDLTFSGKLVLATPIPKATNNCLSSPSSARNSLCFYDPYTPDGTIGFKQLDLAAEKRWSTGTNLGFRVRADLLNVFNWRNWNQYDGRRGLGGGGTGPVNPNLGARNGNEIILPTRTFKLSFGLDW